MSSVPNEVFEDILLSLNRWTLDDVQFTNRRFLQLITERMSDVCLRNIASAYFSVTNARSILVVKYEIRIDGRPELWNTTEYYIAPLFSEFLHLLRGSRVANLWFDQLVLTPELAALVLQAPIVAGYFSLDHSSCAELTPTQFREVVLHFAPTSLSIISCHLRACQLTDGLLQALSKNRMQSVIFPTMDPVDGVRFHVTDDAIVHFCVQEDSPMHQEGDVGELVVRSGRFTKDLFKRLVEASSVSTRTQPLQISVSPVRIGEEDLRDFAQHLSYRRRAMENESRIYDLPDVADMHLQIVLQDDYLTIIRARRPSYRFRTSDE